MVIVYNACMAMVRVERDVAGAIAEYKFAREMRWHPGTLNIDRVEEGQLPIMHVSRRLVVLGVPIPLLSKKMEVPAEVFASHPIPIRHRHGC